MGYVTVAIYYLKTFNMGEEYDTLCKEDEIN